VIAEDIGKAVELGKKGFSHVITFDGTVLSNGLLSGGYHPDISSKKLGPSKIDQALKKFEQEVRDLSL
jgi:hypothetical protein